MAEANTEQGNLAAGLGNEVEADARLVRRTRAGRKDDSFRLLLQDFVGADLVVADDFARSAELAQEVDEIVGEAVVVIDEYQYGLRV